MNYNNKNNKIVNDIFFLNKNSFKETVQNNKRSAFMQVQRLQINTHILFEDDSTTLAFCS